MTRYERRQLRRRNCCDGGGLSGGLLLVGLGLLFLTRWWWPGIMWVIAAATAARGLTTDDPELRRRNLSMAALLAMVPFFITMWSWSWRVWAVGWPLMLLVAGIAIIWKALRPQLPPTWRDSLDEMLNAPEPEPAPTRRPEPVTSDEESAFDRLSTIYDPARDRPENAPVEAPPSPGPLSEQSTPQLPPGDDHIQVDLGAIFQSERRLDRARRGER